jgi:HEAT repeat protein
MNDLTRFLAVAALLGCHATASAQATDSDNEELQIAALEALASAPPERALPLAKKVLAGTHSDEVKESALFVLSQIDLPEAQLILAETARANQGELRYEAIRMIGIGGDPAALAELKSLYATDDEELREAVLEAFLIADDEDAVYELAANAQSEAEFEDAVETLGAMNAREQLRQLRDKAGTSEGWIEAIAISGDVDTLRELALDGSNPERQATAIESLGIVGGGDEVNQTLVDIYRNAGSDEIREAALDGMLIADYDDGVLTLYRESKSAAEKKELLEYLVMMDSEEIWAIIDDALESPQ